MVKAKRAKIMFPNPRGHPAWGEWSPKALNRLSGGLTVQSELTGRDTYSPGRPESVGKRKRSSITQSCRILVSIQVLRNANADGISDIHRIPSPPRTKTQNAGMFAFHFQQHPHYVMGAVQSNVSQQGLFSNLKENHNRCSPRLCSGPPALGTRSAAEMCGTSWLR